MWTFTGNRRCTGIIENIKQLFGSPLFYDHKSAANRVGELLEIWKEDSVQKEQASLDIIMAYIPFSAL